MSIIDCPECGSRISDQATICPKCGIILRPNNDRANGLMITGAVINIFGGIGFIIMFASMMVTTNGSESDYAFFITTGNNYSALAWVAYAALIIITILSFILLSRHNMTRKQVVSLTAIQFALAIISTAFQILTCNLMIFYVGWFLIWGNAIQALGSILCYSGALRLNHQQSRNI